MGLFNIFFKNKDTGVENEITIPEGAANQIDHIDCELETIVDVINNNEKTGQSMKNEIDSGSDLILAESQVESLIDSISQYNVMSFVSDDPIYRTYAPLVMPQASFDTMHIIYTAYCKSDIYDPALRECAHYIIKTQQNSISSLQREFNIGFNRAGRIMDQLQILCIVGKANRINQREILVNDLSSLELMLDICDHESGWIKKFKEKHKDRIKEKVSHYIELIKLHANKELAKLEHIRLEDEKDFIKQKIKERILRQKAKELAIQELAEEGIIEYQQKREPIPQDTQDRVWNRDGGKCVKCGSNENIEFDHIIPHSKGGSNSVRNLQLLCQKCNRGKSNKIG